jgi:hypothetical protein
VPVLLDPPPLLLLLPLPPPPALLLLLPPLGGGLFGGGLLVLLLGGGLGVFGLDVGHLPSESGCDPSGHVCVVVTGGALTMLTGGGDEPVLCVGRVVFPGVCAFVMLPVGLNMPGGTLIVVHQKPCVGSTQDQEPLKHSQVSV